MEPGVCFCEEIMGRITAREKLFQLVFEQCFHDESDFLYDEIMSEENIDEENKNWLSDMYGEIVDKKTIILDDLAKYIKVYKVEDVYKVDLAILMMALYEIKYYKLTPAKIVANESVELAKKFSTPKSAKFVNGVIANIIKDNE